MPKKFLTGETLTLETNEEDILFTEVKTKNYTDLFPVSYFNTNSENINISILCLHILDTAIKKDMKKGQRYTQSNQDPLP
mmetsp:Transcript_7732/g.7162  ORF Transcript_7732/g.7162 Transcript_7732/m.7162 type:complete len:80 (-) Transcript_7732:3240-3479(-)